MRTKAGFRHKILGIKTSEEHNSNVDFTINVFFRSFNNKVVKCWIKDIALGKTFLGTAICDTKHDTFDEKTGMQIAFRKAMDKRVNFIDRRFKVLKKFYKKMDYNTEIELSEKFKNKLEKGKLSCQKFPRENK